MDFKSQTIRFRQDGGGTCVLELENEFVITAGVKANVNTFVTSYKEFDKLGGDLTAEGRLEFFYDGGPGDADKLPLTWFAMRIVDVEPLEYGLPLGAKGQAIVTKWRLMIADARHRFEFPRGGILINGEINRQPFDDASGKDKNGNNLTNNKELVDFCLSAMSAGTSAPAGITSTTAVKDIQWRGNHAPTELAKILDQIGWTMVLTSSGTFQIVKIGSGTFETPSAVAVVPGGLTIPSVERRGKTVIFCSAPTPALDTITITGLGADTWELVCIDSDGKWKQIDTLDGLEGHSALDVIHNHFQDVTQEWRGIVRTLLYRCIRLSPTKYPNVRLLRELHTKKEYSTNFEISGRVAIDAGDGTFTTSDDLVRLHPQFVFNPAGSGTIIQLKERVGNVGDGSSGDIEADFKQLANPTTELRGKVTIEATEPADAGKARKPKYFFCGFEKKAGGGLRKLSDADVQNAIGGADTIIISRPDLQLLLEDGSDVNRQELEDECEKLADRFLAGSGNESKLHVFKGFAKVNLSGRVNEIRIKQAPPLTTVKEMTWWLPQGNYLHINKEATGESGAGGGGGGANGQAYPAQGKTEADRVGQGVAGSAQPAMVVQPGQDASPGKTAGIVKITARGDHGAWYTGVIQKGSATIDPATNFRPNNNGAITGMTDGAAINVLNLLEGGSSHLLSLPCYAPYELIGPGDDNRATVSVRVKPAFLTFTVALQWDGGGVDGTTTTAATWTYTARQFGTLTLGTGMSPRWPRALGPRAKATEGLGQLDAEGNFQLVYAVEPETTVPCEPS